MEEHRGDLGPVYGQALHDVLYDDHIQGSAEVVGAHASGERGVGAVLPEIVVFSRKSLLDLLAHLDIVLRAVDYSDVA